MLEDILKVTLLKETINTDNPLTKDGEPNISQSTTEIYSKRMSITQNEYYSARTKGFKPDLCLEINCFEYNNERFCVVNNIKYEIYRTYQKNNSEFIELYLQAEMQ